MKSRTSWFGRLRRMAAATVLMSFALVAAAFAGNPIPQVVGPPVPQAVVPGRGAFTLTVYGANFVPGAVVNWNRSPRSTTFISARKLQAQILASDVATATAGYVTVTNPPPGGGVSSSSYGVVEVHTPTTTIVAKKPNVYFKGSGASVLDLADFNNDGILDFAASFGKSEIEVLFGNGNGTFGHGSIATQYYDGFHAAAIAIGDLNNDGNEDLVFGANPQAPPSQLGVSLGKGDGKFGKTSHFGHLTNDANGIAVGDFNGDGSLDVATVANRCTLSVFLGQGGGSFKHLADYNQFVATPFEVLSADFNGDGILDLAVLTQGGPYILAGKGDGTFQKPRRLVVNDHIGCSFGPGLFVSDFNGDGKVDLAYCERDQTNGKLWIALGNGDGSFKKPVSYPIKNGVYGFSFAVGDFNSDGKTDVAVSYITFNASVFELFLGNGDGTFQKVRPVNLHGVYNAEEGIVVGDFNSDGLLDFIFQQPGDVSIFTQK